jgi:hypothetical protein
MHLYRITFVKLSEKPLNVLGKISFCKAFSATNKYAFLKNMFVPGVVCIILLKVDLQAEFHSSWIPQKYACPLKISKISLQTTIWIRILIERFLEPALEKLAERNFRYFTLICYHYAIVRKQTCSCTWLCPYYLLRLAASYSTSRLLLCKLLALIMWTDHDNA